MGDTAVLFYQCRIYGVRYLGEKENDGVSPWRRGGVLNLYEAARGAESWGKGEPKRRYRGCYGAGHGGLGTPTVLAETRVLHEGSDVRRKAPRDSSMFRRWLIPKLRLRGLSQQQVDNGLSVTSSERTAAPF